MKPRCPGTKVNGAWTGFVCVLDEGHAEKFCAPYVPPTVDEYRTILSMLAELDAMRAVAESGASSAIQAADLLAKVRENAYAWPYGVAWACKEAHRLLTGGPPDGVYVKTQRDDLAGLARKGDA